MAGHVFIVRGDIRRLTCDAWLMPADARARADEKWLLPTWPAPRWPRPPAEWREGGLRALRLKAWPAAAPQPWLVRAAGGGSHPIAWYLEGVRQFLGQVGSWLKHEPRRNRRPVPLVALPLVGASRDEKGKRAGRVVAELLPLLRRQARELAVDIALVAHNGPAFAAAQAARQRTPDGDTWADLGARLREQGRALADRASQGDLALFLGAGASASAGLPLWSELLDRLAERSTLAEKDRAALRRLNPLDQAAIIERRLGGPEGLQQALREVFTWDHYALPHVLLAALPIREVVTTNYDRLFELAWESQERAFSVLPYCLRTDADSWILKMHGCVSHTEDIVLTREDLLGYPEHFAALAGVVQALLMTRHMLFVGFSLNDDNFHRIADAVRRAVSRSGCDDAAARAFGSALVLERHRLAEELWGEDLDWVSMGAPDAGRAGDDRERDPEAGRRLEIFLDYLAAQIHNASYLLDDRYTAVLSPEEQELHSALLRFERGLSPAARRAPPWQQVRRLLHQLGLRRPHRSLKKSRNHKSHE